MIRLFKQEFNISLINILITSLMAGVIGDAFPEHYVRHFQRPPHIIRKLATLKLINFSRSRET